MNNNFKINLKTRVMVRIYMEFVKSAIIRHIEYILPGAFLLVLLASVSIQNIMNNMPKDNMSHAFNFLFAAVRDTEWAVQGVVALLTVWACFTIFRFAYKLLWKRIDLLKYFGLLRIKY
ncbi:MAG: hypothetical protein AAB861_01455 [Patescibacteria group bacterium]